MAKSGYYCVRSVDLTPGGASGYEMILGGFGKASLTGSIGATVVKDNCKDEYCWGGAGQLSLQGTLSLGGVLKEGESTLVEATGNANTGVTGAIEVDCNNYVVKGKWDGLTASVVFDVLDGYSHFEITKVIYQEANLPIISGAMPEL